jgi:Acetamidase/Formamidase family
MPVHIPESRVIYAFDRTATPVAEIEAGDEVIFATLDPSSGFIKSHEDIATFAEGRRADRVNPATGPVWIHGAEPEDEIQVHILDIQLRSPGWGAHTSNRASGLCMHTTIPAERRGYIIPNPLTALLPCERTARCIPWACDKGTASRLPARDGDPLSQRGRHVDVGTGSVPAASHHGCLCRCHSTAATMGEPQPVRAREEGL